MFVRHAINSHPLKLRSSRAYGVGETFASFPDPDLITVLRLRLRVRRPISNLV